MAGILSPIARRHHVTLMVNKGYSSASAMKAAAERMIRAGNESEAPRGLDGCIVLYLGDHDPSGNDMVRDIEDRLTEFGVGDLQVRKLALTRQQIDHFRPPPNPAKITDSRAAAYIAEHGRSSWELDALPPRDLNDLVVAAIEELTDESRMQEAIETETAERQRVTRAIARSRR